MNPELASRALRRWVRLYSSGLAADLRAARADEIDGDLWSQREEAACTGKSDGALGNEILGRLAFGMTADIAWRLEQGWPTNAVQERNATVGIRVIAVLALLGGIGLVVVTLAWATTAGHWSGDLSTLPGRAVMQVIGIGGDLCLILSLGGLGYVVVERYGATAGMLAILGATGGFLALIGGYVAIALVPVGSVAVAAYLARIHAIHWSLAVVHAIGSPGLIVGVAAYSNPSLLTATLAFVLVYSLSWAAIGASIFGGLPQARPATPSVG